METVINAVKVIMETRPEVEVSILSVSLSDSPYAQAEKNELLDMYLPQIPKERRIFPPCGADKKEFIPGGISQNDYLLDDYTHNLLLWHPPGNRTSQRNKSDSLFQSGKRSLWKRMGKRIIAKKTPKLSDKRSF